MAFGSGKRGMGHIARASRIAEKFGTELFAVTDDPKAVIGFLKMAEIPARVCRWEEIPEADIAFWDAPEYRAWGRPRAKLLVVFDTEEKIGGHVVRVNALWGFPSSVETRGKEKTLRGFKFVVPGNAFRRPGRFPKKRGDFVPYLLGATDVLGISEEVRRQIADVGLRPVRVVGKNSAEYFAEAKVAVVNGGLSAYEAVSCGCLPIIIPANRGQALNARALAQSGLGVVLHPSNLPDLGREICRAFGLWNPVWASFAMKAIDGQGTERVIGEVLSFWGSMF